MPLLAPADRRILRELLSRGGAAEIGEISAATALDGEAVQTSLDTLHQSGIVAPVGSVPGLRGARWSLTQHGHEVGPSLVGNDLAQQHAGDPATQAADPAEGWGFPWRPPKPEAPLYATGLSRRARRVADRAVLSTAGPRRQRRRGGRLLVAILLVAAIIGVVIVGLSALRVTKVNVSGIDESAILRPDQAQGTVLEFTVDGGDLASAQLLLDGQPVSGVQRYDNSIVWPVPGDLPEGTHVVTLLVDRRLFGTAQAAVSFTVDGTPPVVDLPQVFDPVPLGEPVVLAGPIEAGVSLQIGDQRVDTSTGAFSLTLERPPGRPLPVVATDAAGNRTEFDIIVPIGYPHTTGVHVSAAAWDHDGLRSGIVELIEQGRINTVQLDLKDESGRIGYTSDIPLARLSGAALNLFDLKTAIDELHDMGVRVIGRIVAFRDPIMTRYAVSNGDLDWVLQTPDGRPLSAYGGFTNFNHPVIRQYNLDIAAEAAAAGIDDVMWDYMRRPEGSLSGMRIPGWNGDDPSPVIVSFLAEAGEMLRDAEVFHGVAVFGISSDRGEYIAQDIGAMSDHVDYVAPMVYPSHWGRGEHGVVHPEAQPYDITRASLADFQRVLSGTNTAVVPWLQDFTIRISYGADEVRAQIDAANDLGITDWLLWDAEVTYTNEGIPVLYR